MDTIGALIHLFFSPRSHISGCRVGYIIRSLIWTLEIEEGEVGCSWSWRSVCCWGFAASGRDCFGRGGRCSSSIKDACRYLCSLQSLLYCLYHRRMNALGRCHHPDVPSQRAAQGEIERFAVHVRDNPSCFGNEQRARTMVLHTRSANPAHGRTRELTQMRSTSPMNPPASGRRR